MVAELFGRDDELAIVDEVIVGRRNGLAIVGPTGVGKTALLDAAAARGESAAMAIHRIHGTAAAADIAFGAAAHLLPDEIGDDRLSALRDTERAVLDAGGPNGAMVVVDDAGELDAATVALLHAFATHRRLRLVLAVSSDAPIGRSLGRLWRDGHLDRVELGPLPRAAARALLEHLLGGFVADDTERTLWELTRGTPRYLSAIATTERFVHDGGVLRITGDPLSSSELREAVEPLLADLSPPARATLAGLAFANPLPVDLLDTIAGPDATAELEEAGLVATDDAALASTHPVVTGIACAGLTTRHRRAIARALARRAWADAPLEGAALVRAVVWELEGGGEVEPTTIVAAARTALADGDFATGASLAEVASSKLDPPDDWEAAFLLGQARRQLGDRDGAERAFAAAMHAPNDAHRVDVGIARAHNIGIAAGDVDAALTLLAGLADSVQDPGLARRIAVEQAFLGAVIGDFRQVADAATAVLADPHLDDLTAGSAASGHLFASVMLLRLDEFDATRRRTRPVAERLEARYPLALDQVELLAAVADVAGGRIAAAIDRCEARRARPVDESFGCGDGAWRAIETFARAFTIDPDLAGHGRRAIVGLRSVDPVGLRYVGSGIAALAIAHAGGIDEAARAWAVAAPSSEGERRSGLLISARLDAWRAATAGELDRAGDLVADAGRVAIEFGHLLWGLLGLHDAVRFGRADRVVDAIEDVCCETRVTGALSTAIRRHARAAASKDPEALAAAVDAFVAIGATRLAVEAAVQTGRAFGDHRDGISAQRWLARAQVIAGGALPPIPVPGGPTGALTDRQAEIVVLLAAGLTGPEIADRLSLSVRTVENHVAAVYRHLGVSNRRDLLDVTGVARDRTPPSDA